MLVSGLTDKNKLKASPIQHTVIAAFSVVTIPFEPSHKNMALFVLRKMILQTRMRSHLGKGEEGAGARCLICLTSCARTTKDLARLRGCAGSLEPSLVVYVISTIISWAGSFVPCWILWKHHKQCEMCAFIQLRSDKTSSQQLIHTIRLIVIYCIKRKTDYPLCILSFMV